MVKIKLVHLSLEVTNISVSKMMRLRRKRSRVQIRLQNRLKSRTRRKKMVRLGPLRPLLRRRIPTSRSLKKTILKIRRLLRMVKMRTKLNTRGSKKVHDTGLKKTQQSNVTIASSSDTCQESVPTTPKGSIASSVAKTPMTPSIAQKRCVSNATKLVTKQKSVRRRTWFNVTGASILVIVRQDALKHGQLRVQV